MLNFFCTFHNSEVRTAVCASLRTGRTNICKAGDHDKLNVLTQTINANGVAPDVAYCDARRNGEIACAVCGKAEADKAHHCHVCGMHIGTLCGTCNLGEGLFKDEKAHDTHCYTSAANMIQAALANLDAHGIDASQMTVAEVLAICRKQYDYAT